SSADELVLEAVVPDRSRLGAIAAPGYRPESLSLGRAQGASFVATTRLAISAGRDRGMDVGKGADMVLRRVAEDEGKAVEGLESVGFQMGMFNRMAPTGLPLPAPIDTLDAKTRLTALLVQMQLEWNRGDQRIFVALLDEMQRNTPENYRRMFPERNAHWADWIVNRMGRPGTVFVAVGAGHFAGPDSVLSKLTLKGKVATRAY
ncbi:MAG: TraB/GumN family protein, partial [Sphingomicrobium sp.]